MAPVGAVPVDMRRSGSMRGTARIEYFKYLVIRSALLTNAKRTGREVVMNFAACFFVGDVIMLFFSFGCKLSHLR